MGDRDAAGARDRPASQGAGGTLAPKVAQRVPPALVPADDERMLVQPACGAALALLYAGRLQQLQREGRLRPPLGSVVVVVCGGGGIQAAQLRALKSQLGLE